MYIAISLAVVCGILFALNTFQIQQIINSGFNIDQANYDSCLVQGCVFLCLFINEYNNNQQLYVPLTWIYSNAYQILIIIGIIIFSKALGYGKGGSVQAIQETKTIVQTVLCVIFDGLVPNWIQINGLISGLIGVAIIVLQTKKN